MLKDHSLGRFWGSIVDSAIRFREYQAGVDIGNSGLLCIGTFCILIIFSREL